MNVQPTIRPTTRTTEATTIMIDRWNISFSANDHVTDLQRGCCDGPNERHIIADHFDILEHLAKVAGDGHLLYRVKELAVLNPNSHSSAGVIAGHCIDSKADQLDHIEPLVD